MVEQFHSITPSLDHFLLDIWNPGVGKGELPYEKVKDARQKILIQLPKEANVGVARAPLDPQKITLKME